MALVSPSNVVEDYVLYDSFVMAKSLVISNRREAIRTAILTAPDGATILLAGKGHENYQVIGHEKTHFDEKEIVEETFKLMLK